MKKKIFSLAISEILLYKYVVIIRVSILKIRKIMPEIIFEFGFYYFVKNENQYQVGNSK